MTATEYIYQRFEETKFPFISLMEVYNKSSQSKEEVKKELNILAKNVKIRKREGFNFDLIEKLQ
jgi:hypothetical protein